MTAPRRRAAALRAFPLAILCAGLAVLFGAGSVASDGPGLDTSAAPAAGAATASSAATAATSTAADQAIRQGAPTVAQTRVTSLKKIAGALQQPVFVTNAGDDRLFVVERAGRIQILKKVSGSWHRAGTFLDIRFRIEDGYSEQGLLGLAFHPDYDSNHIFYVYYTNLHKQVVVAEYRRSSGDPDKADPSSGRIVLKVNHPYDNHNAGWMAFKGPYLYIAIGDGGLGGDPGDHGQRVDTLLGKILRIDPLEPDGSGPRRYGVPGDNPFVGHAGRDEIWAYGFRNPWRDSFDSLTGDLWVGDVGQDRYEEVDHHGTGKGKNFGWRRLEGRHKYPSGSLCHSGCKTLPVAEYSHTASGTDNCAVTGGYVSRRSGAPLYGKYIFADYCSGRIWTIPERFSGGSLPSPYHSGLSVSSFGQGDDGVIYVVSLGGSIYRVVGT